MTLVEFHRQAGAVYVQLLAAAASARVELAGGTWFGDVGVDSGTIAAISNAERLTPGLAPSGPVTARVLSGEKSIAWWEEQAERVRELISEAMGNRKGALPSWTRISAEILKPTAAQFVDEVKDGAAVVADVIPLKVWIAGGLGLGLALLILAGVYLPSPKGS